MERYLVLGLGVSGKAVTEYLLSQGSFVIGVDKQPMQDSIQLWKNQICDKNLSIYGEKDFDLAGISCAIISPGIGLDNQVLQAIIQNNIPWVGEAEFALRRIKEPCIGITGSNGKTTMTLFITHLLKTAGIQAEALGNVGRPFSEYLLQSKPAEVCVCELSSYQLESLQAPCLDLGMILQITPDHMDRYKTFEDYAYAKFNLLKCLKPSGQAWVSHPTYERFKEKIVSLHSHVNCIPEVFCYQNKNCYLQLTKNKEYCDFLPLIKEKALGNELLFLAAAVAKVFSLTPEILHQALAEFKKPEHRCELVEVINDVAYYNDSKATNVESVMYAVNTLQEQIYIIVGGKDKNLRFDPWIKAFKDTVEHVFAIGESAETIQRVLAPHHTVELCGTLENALRRAASMAKPRSKVLLSPGCASFDQFKDYRHRGECFKNFVTALKNEVL